MRRRPKEKTRYHHGNLPATLIEAGLRLLQDREADDLGLREVARAAGVSAAAVYRHFPDKDALLRGLAAEGLRRLASEQNAAAATTGGGAAAFSATGRAYVRFALANPALFRLMFSKAPESGPLSWDAMDDDASGLLREYATLLVAKTSNPDTARIFALRAWALVHGLAVLVLDKRLPPDLETIDAIINAHDTAFIQRIE